MPNRTSVSGSDLFIVDNSDEDWKVVRYLHDWCQLSKAIDIASGYFEIGALLALKDEWQKVDTIRILMGDEVSLRTRQAFYRGLQAAQARLDESVEREKEKNDFLTGVPSIVEGIRSGKIVCRVYKKDKFHAKAYITHARIEVVGSAALVGSSNFTYPGLTENIELNVQITGRPVAVLQEWFEEHWNQSEDVTAELLTIVERHVREYPPFDIYAKALHEFFRGHIATLEEWERIPRECGGSCMLPNLDTYQVEGYRQLVNIARQHGGAFLCDGVGLGKTFVGLMLIERLVVQERKNVILLVPKAARKPVWEQALKRYLPKISGTFSNLTIWNHTDLQRSGQYAADLVHIKERAHAVIIDEAHHFRNKGVKGTGNRRQSRYHTLYDLLETKPGDIKQIYMLTATPINNKLTDLQHMIELFARDQSNYFANTVGVHSLQGHFRRMEKSLRQQVQHQQSGESYVETDFFEAEKVLADDALFQALVVQRSRAFVKRSQLQQGASVAMFPTREDPKVAQYSVKKTYGNLLGLMEKAFARKRPLFSLAIYYPVEFFRGPEDQVESFEKGRQEQVVGLIRTQFLKRFESSAHAFGLSCERLLVKLLAFAERHSQTPDEKRRLNLWRTKNEEIVGAIHSHQTELFGLQDSDNDEEEDIISTEMLENVTELSREEYRVEEILSETFDDLSTIAEFLHELKRFEPKHDDKLRALIKLLKTDPIMKKHKVLIFTEYADTAHYLHDQLSQAGVDGLDEVDSSDKRNRGDILRRFAPYYNGSSSGELKVAGEMETRVLIATDVLSEGLNLQDATRLINYDIHWNPVRLMQRIGRVDRRMNPETEDRILADHPEQNDVRGKVAYWNFLPPDELDSLLNLYGKVAHKTLRISKTFGIEGSKLLTETDDYEALREFNAEYDGNATPMENLHLEYNELAKDPQLLARLDALPGRVFSGKRHPTPGTRAVFFCYNLPAAHRSASAVSVSASSAAACTTPAVNQPSAPVWTEAAGRCAWYLYNIAGQSIIEDPAQIVNAIRCLPETDRICEIPQETLTEIRQKVEKQIKNTYFKQLQAPLGVKPVLKCWMELN